ncbi:hypothetical protein BH10BAC6_BH10BAC6_11700 [soil metagenome]
MLIAHHPSLLHEIRRPTKADPLRVLVSGCLAGWQCGVSGTDYGLGQLLQELFALPTIHVVPFCPEHHSLGTPRTMPDIHGGDGVDVLAGTARVLDEHGTDITQAMIEGGKAMLAAAQAHRAELAILTENSAACGSQVISDGCRFDEVRKFRKGVGVATAILLEGGLPVIGLRDMRSLAALRSILDETYSVPSELVDHHDHPWTREHLPMPHPRA